MKIRGNTVGTPTPRSDLNQTNPMKADYVKGRELVTDHIAAKGNVHGLTAEQVGAEPAGTAQAFVGSHNTNTAAHNDIRILIADLINRLNAIANSDDNTLDQMAEIVDYIKDNRELIETITTSKVNVSDIIDNLYTNVPNKPLSAAQGVALKSLIDTLAMFVEQEAAGCPIVIDGAADKPLIGMVLYGKTTQDGTPSPENPVELVNAGADGDIAVKVYRENSLPFPYTESSANQAGVKVVAEDDGSITWKGTPVGYVGLYLYRGSPIWSGLTTFTYCGDCKNLIFEIAISSASGNQTLTGNPLAINFDNYSNITNVYVLLKREVNNVPTDGTVYPIVVQDNIEGNMHSASIPTPNGLPGIPVSSGGNYTDASGQQWICDEMDFERGVYVKRVGSYTTNGEERFTVANGHAYISIYNSGLPSIGGGFWSNNVLCDSFKPSSPGSVTAGYVSNSCGGADYNFYFILDSTKTTEDDYRAVFSKGVKVIYILEEPIETPLDADTIATYKTLHTYSPSTTILNDGGAWMHVKYSGYNNSFINSVAELVSEHNVSPAAHDDIRTAIAEAKSAATTAQSTANTANTTAKAALPKAGGTMTGAIAMGGNKITGLATPTDNADAVPKSYADWFTPIGAANNAASDLLQISTTGDFSRPFMHRSVIATEDASALTNAPISSGAFYAIREVDVIPNQFGGYHTLVTLREMYPVQGRVWTRMYDINAKAWRPSGHWMETYPNGRLMTAGTEWETEEHWKGKRVYATHIAQTLDSVGNASTYADYKVPHGISGFVNLVRVEANFNAQYNLPYMGSAGDWYGIVVVDSKHIHLRGYKGVWSSPTLNATIYYTKG